MQLSKRRAPCVSAGEPIHAFPRPRGSPGGDCDDWGPVRGVGAVQILSIGHASGQPHKHPILLIRVEFVCDALVPRGSIVTLEFLEVRL